MSTKLTLVEKNLAIAKSNVDAESPVLYLKVGFPIRPKTAKLTPAKRRIVLQKLMEEWDVSRAAAAVGVTFQAVSYLVKTNQDFREAYEEVKNAWLNRCEYASLKLASLPTREGYNDRALMLQSHRPETYAKKSQVEVKQDVNVNLAVGVIRNILSRHGLVNVEEEK